MRKLPTVLGAGLLGLTALVVSAREPADVLPTGAGDIAIFPIAHASLVLVSDDATVHVDPVGDLADYRGLPLPDAILITHDHGDHFAPDLVRELATEHTRILAPLVCAEAIPGNDANIVAPGDSLVVAGVSVVVVPAYNTTPGREKYHPRGRGVGYVLEFVGTRVYVSGDTEAIPEMRTVAPVDAAFLAINQPYTMTVEQAAAAVAMLEPGIVYPYHFRGRGGQMSDLARFTDLVGRTADVRVLDWYPDPSARETAE